MLDINKNDGSFLYSRVQPDDQTGKENGGYKFSHIPQSGAYKKLISDQEIALFEKGKSILQDALREDDIKRVRDIGGAD